jgi:putative transposase
MPNHIHGIIIIHEPVGARRRLAPTEIGISGKRTTRFVALTDKPHGTVTGSIGAIIGQFKSIAKKQINRLRGTPGAPVWQRNYYEHVIRNETELNRIREYIRNNPLKWTDDRENEMFNGMYL